MTTQEKKNDRLGMGISLGIHAALLVLFIFLLAWKEPFPPLPEYGIEVNFGLETAGSGDIQPTTPANNNPEPVLEEPAPEPPATTEEIDTEPPTETSAEEITSPESEEIEEVEDVTDPIPEPEVTQPTPDAVPVEEKKKEEQPVEEKPVEKETPKLDPSAAYPNKERNTSGADGKDGSSEKIANSNQGDQPGNTGDQGNPEGKIDARALYGKPGGGGGAALDMSGWNWDFLPDGKDPGNAEGHIVFEIKIDEEGEILSIRTISKTVSDTTVKFYRSEVAKLTFSPTSTNSRPAPTTTGRITFIITAK